jgi:hypothetical protein
MDMCQILEKYQNYTVKITVNDEPIEVVENSYETPEPRVEEEAPRYIPMVNRGFEGDSKPSLF